MTPKQKAKSLIASHTLYLGGDNNFDEVYTDKLDAKRHALTTIKEILKLDLLMNSKKYWNEVKTELEKQ